MAPAEHSQNVLEETWLAYAFRRDPAEGWIREALERVHAHYQLLFARALRRTESIGQQEGMALWQPDAGRSAWPLWAEEGPLATACTTIPTGSERVIGRKGPPDAARELGRVLDKWPRKAVELNAPFVIAVRNQTKGRIRIVNDSLGIGRLYELRTDRGWVWSNRVGVLPIFAGIQPKADDRAWALLAAAGWFLGESAPIAGTRKIKAGTIITVQQDIDGAVVEEKLTEERETALVSPRSHPSDAAAQAAEQVGELADSLGRFWKVRPSIDLSGGRDSRVSAAGAVRAGLEAEFKTADNEPGELDIVDQLIATAPRPLEHVVNQPESEQAVDSLTARLRAIHLVHDGMRNPQEVRRPTELPHRGVLAPSVSGHGGEIGHGFYYANRRALWRLRPSSVQRLGDRLMVAARRRHSAATAAAYAAYREECERVLVRGQDAGVRGPTLLDYFYLAERLPYRSGLGARSARYSACVVPAFVRAAFDLKPSERLRAKLHSEVVSRLVPEWRRIPFFVSGSGQMPRTRRARIWEKDEHAQAISAMINEGRGWPEMFDPDRIRQMWAEVRDGRGSADYEHVFYRLVWRVGYEDHLERLGAAALRVPART